MSPHRTRRQTTSRANYDAPMRLTLGERTHDLRSRPLVMGILNRTRDSFFDRGAHYAADAFLRHAERLVRDGADILDVGARPGGVGVRPVSEAEETDLAAASVAMLAARFDVPISVDSTRAAVATAAFAEGAVMGNDMSGFADPGYLPAAARAGAAVIATHIRLPPGVPDPEPRYDDLIADVKHALEDLTARAVAAGIPAERIVVDPGFDLGKTWQQSLALLGHLDALTELGQPVLIAVSNKIFLGRALSLDTDERSIATVAACGFGVSAGGRVLRVHDVRAGRQVADLYGAVRAAADGHEPPRPAANSRGVAR
jgi:dihydropteroate synthase